MNRFKRYSRMITTEIYQNHLIKTKDRVDKSRMAIHMDNAYSFQTWPDAKDILKLFELT